MTPERIIQRAVRCFCAGHKIVAIAIPNGAHLAGDRQARIRQASALKADGMLPGFPDLLLYHPQNQAIAHVEVKTAEGKLSPSQRECHAWLKAIGHHIAVVRSVEDMDAALRQWGWI